MRNRNCVFLSIVGIPVVTNFFVLVCCAAAVVGVFVAVDYAREAKKTGSWMPGTQKAAP